MPESTAVLRFKAVVDNLRNADTSNAQLDRISTRLLPLASNGQSTAGWTNNQIADAINSYLRMHIRQAVFSAAFVQENAAVSGTVQANTNAAAADLD